jgi:hypothetical protein
MDKDIYISKFHKKFVVMKTTDNYLIKMIGENNVAACMISKKLIIINKYETELWGDEHYDAIESHEICHFLAKHVERDNIQSEKEADKMAYTLLKSLNLKKSAILIYDRFEDFHKLKINDFKLKFKLKVIIFSFILKKILRLDNIRRIYTSKKKKLWQII